MANNDGTSRAKPINVDELELTDAELATVLKNHGIDRRMLMRVFGVGAGVAALGGTASAQGASANIDEVYGAPYALDDKVPPGLPDYTVELDHLIPGDHDEFPAGGDGPPGEFVFDPVGLHVKPGGVVHFDNQEGEHTVTAFHEKWPFFRYPGFTNRVPDGVPGFTSPPYVGDESWLYRFTEKGVYDVLCLPHLGFGMVMRIVVFDPRKDDIDDDAFDGYGPLAGPPGAPGNPFANVNAVLTNEALDPENIVSEGRIRWADLTL